MKSADNRISMIEEEAERIISVLMNGNKNYIFGCGWMGKKTLAVIKVLGITIDGFIVSKKEQEFVDDIPVYEMREVPKDNKNIFVALRDQDSKLNDYLQEMADIVFPITYPKDITVLEAKYYLNYFKDKQINCNTDFIQLGDYSFVNPFFQDYDYMLSWVYEAGDLILPVVFDDFTRIDEGTYELDITMLEPGDVVFDCGANIGLFSVVAMKKNCKVYAFEPMPAAIEYLKQIQGVSDSQLQICPYALSDHVGKAVFHVQNFDLIGASLLETHNSIDQDYTVNVMTIDEYVKQNHIEQVNYIKADIEGSERDMLLGAKDTIRRFSPKISICTYHLPDDPQFLENRIKDINPNYIIKHQWKKLYAYVPK